MQWITPAGKPMVCRIWVLSPNYVHLLKPPLPIDNGIIHLQLYPIPELIAEVAFIKFNSFIA
jgi:hypothetical protein